VLSYGLDFINRELMKRFGEDNYEILDSDVIGDIQLIDYQVVEDLITQNIGLYNHIKGIKETEKEIQRKDFETCIQRGKESFYKQDEVFNDGMEGFKERQVLKKTDIWDSGKY
jgi:hypothetical protein